MRQGLHRAWESSPSLIRTPVALLWRSIHLYFEDSCGTYAAAIAYYAIFSIVPLALVTLSLLGMLIDTDRIVQFVFDQIPLREDPDVQQNVNEIVSRAKSIGVAGLGVGFVALIWSSSGIFAAVRRGLNVASHRQRRRPYWRGKLVDFTLIPSLGILILVSIGLTTLVQGVIEQVGEIGTLGKHENVGVTVASYTLPAVVSFMMFILLYRYVPSSRPRWQEAALGASLATLLFELTKNLYALLLVNLPFERDTAIYASFGTAMAFLFWMFLNASIMLLGAEFARAARLYADDRDAVTRESEPRGRPGEAAAPRIGGVDTSHRGL